MTVPLLLLVGGAGAGKDTIASILVKNHGAVCFSFADPIKRFLYEFFLFTEEQLWGPSDLRNVPDLRFATEDFRDEVRCNYWSIQAYEWLKEVCNHLPREQQVKAVPQLHKLCSAILEYSQSNPLTPRYVLQQVGTFWGRSVDENLWTTYALNTAQLLATGNFSYNPVTGFDHQENNVPKLIVISDGRFLNEVEKVKEANGVVWKINSPQATTNDSHVSETEQQSMADSLFAIIVNNDKSNGLVSLERLVKYIHNWTVDGQFLPKGS